LEKIEDDNSYYTMNDLTLNDAIEPLGEIVSGIECINSQHFYIPLSAGCLDSINTLGEFCTKIISMNTKNPYTELPD